MSRKLIVRLLRLVAIAAICFIGLTRAEHRVAHASAALSDPFGSWSGESPDNFWSLNYVHCTDGLIVHAQQVKHTGETVDPNGVLSSQTLPYSINLRSVQVGGANLALTTKAPLVSSQPPTPSYQVYTVAGSDGTNTDPLSSTVVFQHATQAVNATGTTTFERWDHGLLGLFANGQDDDADADGDTTSGVGDEDGDPSDDVPTDGSAHDDAKSFDASIQDCSVLPTTTASLDAANPANTQGWNSGSPIKVDFSATDTALTTADSGQGVDHINVSAQRADGTGSFSQTLPGSSGSVNLTSDGTWTVTFDATDTLGNTEAAKTLVVYIDSVAPSLNISGPASGAVSVCSGVPSRPSFSPSDPNLADNSPGSGVASQSDSFTHGTLQPSGVGSYTYTASATDNAGNTRTETRTYTVTYPWTALLSPVVPPKASYKLGSTIPVKFQLLCAGVPITNAVAYLVWSQGANVNVAATSTSSSTTGNLFRYDPSGQQYIFNMSTSTKLTAGTATLTVVLDDGTRHSIPITLTS